MLFINFFNDVLLVDHKKYEYVDMWYVLSIFCYENLYPIKTLLQPPCTMGQQYLSKQLLNQQKVDNNNYDYKCINKPSKEQLGVGHVAFKVQ